MANNSELEMHSLRSKQNICGTDQTQGSPVCSPDTEQVKKRDKTKNNRLESWVRCTDMIPATTDQRRCDLIRNFIPNSRRRNTENTSLHDICQTVWSSCTFPGRGIICIFRKLVSQSMYSHQGKASLRYSMWLYL